MFDVDHGIRHPSRDDHLQPRKLIDHRCGQSSALSHRHHDLGVLQPIDEDVLVRDVLGHHVDRRRFVNLRPVGQIESDVLIIVENHDSHTARPIDPIQLTTSIPTYIRSGGADDKAPSASAA